MRGLRPLGGLVGVAVAALVVGVGASSGGSDFFVPGNLVVSPSVYDNNPANVQAGVTVLPPGCTSGCATAIATARYPYVFNNDLVDASFGITSKIFLDQLTPTGSLVNSLEVPNSSAERRAADEGSDGRRASRRSPSSRSTSRPTASDLTFMGYLAPIDALDVSNSNTPGVVDPTNPVPGPTTAWSPTSTRTASSASPRRTPIAATTAAPRS